MNYFIEATTKIMLRDLDKLEKEISLYPTLISLWVIQSDLERSFAFTLI